MPAYFVAIREETRDAEEMKLYSEKAGAPFAGIAMTPRAIRGKLAALEGAAPEAVVILEFPTFEEAEAWYHSPVYQEVAQHRFRGATYRTFITQGL